MENRRACAACLALTLVMIWVCGVSGHVLYEQLPRALPLLAKFYSTSTWNDTPLENVTLDSASVAADDFPVTEKWEIHTISFPLFFDPMPVPTIYFFFWNFTESSPPTADAVHLSLARGVCGSLKRGKLWGNVLKVPTYFWNCSLGTPVLLDPGRYWISWMTNGATEAAFGYCTVLVFHETAEYYCGPNWPTKCLYPNDAENKRGEWYAYVHETYTSLAFRLDGHVIGSNSSSGSESSSEVLSSSHNGEGDRDHEYVVSIITVCVVLVTVILITTILLICIIIRKREYE